jgi:hypothetical protein
MGKFLAMHKIWTIQQLERKSDNDFVVNVHWKYSFAETPKDGGVQYYAETYGVISYTQSDNSKLIPYKDLTEQIVIGWVKESIDVQAIEKNLLDQIEAQKNPPILQGLPW